MRTSDRFLASTLGNEIVMMDTLNGNYIGLNEVSSSIWNYLEIEQTIEELILKLLSDFEVNLDGCVQETLQCLDKMLTQGLLSAQ
ncbi:PqqD family peptide modification chaperone [Pedobacter sp. L105]|uniref:PqqD family peptide modification chaperone n=1 Tax=Pedobacter sp. L105 TaxID=1641871 RepID=UPI0020B1778E|nr:PqqD family peptide modification chaperone [Pedobacter sp. L105]